MFLMLVMRFAWLVTPFSVVACPQCYAQHCRRVIPDMSAVAD